jgi:hypothetical protein
VAQTSALFDGWGVIHDAAKRLHRVVGYKEAVYRADIDKVSGWRIHVQYEEGGQVHLKDIVEGRKHDDVLGQIEAKKIRYQRPKAKGKRD